MRSNKPLPLYIIYMNSIDDKEYAIQGKYKKNMDKYFDWYGKLKNAPPDIMVLGFLVLRNHKNGIIDADSSNSVTLRVKDLKPAWITIANDSKKNSPKIPKF